MKQSEQDTSMNLEKGDTDVMSSNQMHGIKNNSLSGASAGHSDAVKGAPSGPSCKHSREVAECKECTMKNDKENTAQYTDTKGYVWTRGTPTGNVGQHITINDLENDEQAAHRYGYTRMHRRIIIKHLGYTVYWFLAQGIFGRLFFPIESIHCPEQFLRESMLSYSTRPLLIPGWLDYAVRVLFLMNLEQHGIFRVNSTVQHVTAVRALINDLVEGRLAEKNGIKMLTASFDAIDIAETYKQLLRSFNTTIISSKYFPIIKAIQNIPEEQDKRICTRALLYSLPALNRRILESNARLVHLLVAKMGTRLDNKQMNLEGMSKVMMPCLMLKSEDDIAIEDVLIFAEFIHFLLRHFKDLIYV